VLPASELPPEDEERPPWHWSAVATVGAFVLWLPLIFAVNAIVKEPGPLWGALNAFAFVLANGLAGGIVGRFGGKAGTREAAAGGVIAGGLAWILAFMQAARTEPLAWGLVFVVIVALGGGASAAGGRLGLRARAARPGPGAG
jgi:tRNA-(ms[2]io[6]A)-hydroxylase